ncbi:MAG: hypothetical protein ACKO40_08455 [Planctomycetaceae bacterium]
MAREIVITSVPRGVKLGRTGFQVAMQTAGLRDDLSSQLEKMAGYRHLPSGVPNPVCYFHRITKTFAGQVSVLGRIVDAGVDFSNRSNKLAHMVALEAADVGQVGSSSPAAALAAIEGRLASTWPGPPEERQSPFALAGIPASQAAPCSLWQQVMGDAGWAGVLAERAVRGQPTLVIGPDSSPASCRRMLALFQEALAIVPAAKRWSVTFDTTSLSPEGVLWRGTYAGSPESQAAQPGVLVVDLSRPQAIPSNLAAGDLVTIAREGPPRPVVPRPGVPAGTTGPQVSGQGPQRAMGNDPGSTAAGGPPAPPAPPGVGGPRTLAPIGGGVWDGVPAGQRRRPKARSKLFILALGLSALMVSLGGVAAMLFLPGVFQSRALDRFHAYAASGKNPPTVADLRTATRITTEDLSDDDAEKATQFLNDWLADDEVPKGKTQAVSSDLELRKVLGVVQTVMNPSGNGDGFSASIDVLCPGAHASDRAIVAASHSNEGFRRWEDLANALSETKECRVKRSTALKSIQAYAQDPVQKSPPSHESYCLALDMPEKLTAGNEGTEDNYVKFLNGFLESGTSAASAVETQGQLKDLLGETEKVLADADPTHGRGLRYLTGVEDESFSKLLDGLHPGPFADFETFACFVKDLRDLRELAKTTEDRGGKQVGDVLWKAIVGLPGFSEDRLGDDKQGKTFVRGVSEEDLASISALKKALERLYPKRAGVGRGSPETTGAPTAGELPTAIADFMKRVRKGGVLQELEKGETVELFPVTLSACQKVAGRPGLKTDLVGISGGAEVRINDKQVLVIELKEKFSIRKGSSWNEHKDDLMFLPIGFAKDAASPIGKEDWIVLSPPVRTLLPSAAPTLHDLFFQESESQEVALPDNVKAVPVFRLVSCDIQVSEAALKVQVKASSKGDTADIRITAHMTNKSTDVAIHEFPCTLTERIEVVGGEVRRLSSSAWGNSRARRMLLQQNHNKPVSPVKEPRYVGVQSSSSGESRVLETVNRQMLEALVHATASAWSVKEIKYSDAEDIVVQWGRPSAKDQTVEEWRKYLRDWLAGRPSFADWCREKYTNDGEKPVEPVAGKKGSDATADQKALDKYEEAVAAYITDQPRHFASLQKYVESKCTPKGKVQEMGADVAAACFLLEIEGLIVAKACGKELEEVLRRIPVGSLVEGQLKPREWTSWVASGVPAPIPGGKIDVDERVLARAEVLQRSAEPAGDAASPAIENDASGGPSAGESREGGGEPKQ